MKAYSPPTTSEEPIAGYAVLDDKGRLGLPKDLRQRLGVRTGGNFSYTLLDGMVRLHVATAPAAERDRAMRVSVDERGRITLLRPIRRALDAGPGSTLAYILLDDTLLLIPQDDQLRALIGRAERALAGTGARTHDLLDELPAIRDEVMREAYGDAFMDALAREHAALHGQLEPG
jgi:bifunctional DNA-binding transcriptional regulator/antitoxin component of YhaV-PrlF toxin-antitoxin module